jgi:hypothetical protein
MDDLFQLAQLALVVVFGAGLLSRDECSFAASEGNRRALRADKSKFVGPPERDHVVAPERDHVVRFRPWVIVAIPFQMAICHRLDLGRGQAGRRAFVP